MINVFQPSLGQEELQAVAKVFESNWIGKGKKTEEFEKAFHQWVGAPSGDVATVQCCTEGLFQMVALLQLSSKDEVIMPTVSFVGAGNAVASSGAKVVFADVDPRTMNITPEALLKSVTPKTRAVVLIHYGGYPCEMEPILEICKEHNIVCIEDTATAIASKYKNKFCGTLGDMGVWSFDAMKILVTGDGGLVYFKKPDQCEKFKHNTYLGLVTQSGFSNKVDARWWEFEIESFGRRAIINDITAAIAIEQLKKLPQFIARRKEIASMYDKGFATQSYFLTPPPLKNYMESTYYMYWIQMENADTRDNLALFLREKGIYTTFRYYPLHLVKKYGSNVSLPEAESAAQRTLCLPIHQSISDAEAACVIAQVLNYWRK